MSIPDGQKERDKVEASQAVTSHVKFNVVVERFPRRPIFPTIHDMDGDSGDLFKTTRTLEDKAIQQEKMPSMESSNSLVIEKDMKKNQDVELELNRENVEEKVELNLQIPSLEGSNSCTVGTGVLDIKNVESNGSMPDGTKAVDSTENDTIMDRVDRGSEFRKRHMRDPFNLKIIIPSWHSSRPLFLRLQGFGWSEICYVSAGRIGLRFLLRNVLFATL